MVVVSDVTMAGELVVTKEKMRVFSLGVWRVVTMVVELVAMMAGKLVASKAVWRVVALGVWRVVTMVGALVVMMDGEKASRWDEKRVDQLAAEKGC